MIISTLIWTWWKQARASAMTTVMINVIMHHGRQAIGIERSRSRLINRCMSKVDLRDGCHVVWFSLFSLSRSSGLNCCTACTCCTAGMSVISSGVFVFSSDFVSLRPHTFSRKILTWYIEITRCGLVRIGAKVNVGTGYRLLLVSYVSAVRQVLVHAIMEIPWCGCGSWRCPATIPWMELQTKVEDVSIFLLDSQWAQLLL